MSERKVLTKYYPPDFDPSKITRTPKHLRPTGPKTISVRLMAPFSMKCTSCGEYIYKGRKFNARKETTDEKYLNIQIYRFYIRCTGCSSEITFKTDPKNMDYTCEKGAKRNFEKWRDPTSKELQETDEQRLDRLEREEAEAAEEEERNAMEELEQKMEDSKREMAVADALDSVRTRNARLERNAGGAKEESALAQTRQDLLATRARQDEEDEALTQQAFARKNREILMEQEIEDEVTGTTLTAEITVKSSATFERIARPRKPVKAPTSSHGDVKQIAQVTAAPVNLNLVGYDSDDE